MLENKKQLTNEIEIMVKNALIDSILFAVDEYEDIMTREEIMKEFSLQCSKLIDKLNREFEQQEKENEEYY